VIASRRIKFYLRPPRTKFRIWETRGDEQSVLSVSDKGTSNTKGGS
jgi:hypothetical protein